jgi:hypothetical protein
MYDLFLVGLALSIQHVAVAYAAIEIWKLDYRTYIMATTGFGIVMGLILKGVMTGWKDRIGQAMREEVADRELFPDLLLFVVSLLAGGMASSYLVYRRFGVMGWLGGFAANMFASWIV